MLVATRLQSLLSEFGRFAIHFVAFSVVLEFLGGAARRSSHRNSIRLIAVVANDGESVDSGGGGVGHGGIG